ncbi:hypothetical protein [Raoultella ornithinolytica]|uniref:hypothetical protein n=1 Tax=Raoultella ornithinolytica TaxID=54291 RepID=UPI00366D4FA1
MEHTLSIELDENNTEMGATESERYLSKLARKTFLNFWSYSNPYTDENKGSELCDFMVVFGNDIILFSDKHCEYPKIKSDKTAWYRWYRSAINKSVRQLSGAASFIKRFPNRIFIDSECKTPFPIPLPSSENLKIHLIAVTRGSAEACAKYFGGGSSSSLVINTKIEEKGHKENPFMIGWPLGKSKFVHVLDELTLDVLLKELDTASDFVNYLTKKEKYLGTKDADFVICGEEELLAHYLLHPLENYEGFSFPPVPSNKKMVYIEEGTWRNFCESDAYSSWKKINEISYEWDRLIESQTSHIKHDSAAVLKNSDVSINDIQAHELVLRAMADEGRATRQVLASHYHLIRRNKTTDDRIVKTIIMPNRPNRAYILLVLKFDPAIEYYEYRELRRASLVGFCRACRLRMKGIDEVIGIASEQLDCPFTTQDFILMNFEAKLTQEEKEKEVETLKSVGIWKDSWTCI